MTTPEARPRAPGPLALVQEFLNSIDVFQGSLPVGVVRSVRLAGLEGATTASLARDYGLTRADVAAILRGVDAGDELGTGSLASEWFTAHKLVPPDTRLSDHDAERLRALRAMLRDIAASHSTGGADNELMTRLNSVAATVSFRLVFASDGVSVLPWEGDGDLGVAAILAAVFAGVQSDTWKRLKICAGDQCPAAFYDTSRSRTGSWCAMSVCGNRAKTRAFQKRRRER